MIELSRKLELTLKKEIYKKSYYEFFKDVFVQLHPGEQYSDNWYAEYLCGVLQKEAEEYVKLSLLNRKATQTKVIQAQMDILKRTASERWTDILEELQQQLKELEK